MFMVYCCAIQFYVAFYIDTNILKWLHTFRQFSILFDKIKQAINRMQMPKILIVHNSTIQLYTD